ncbi:MAG TPA: large-conductance mechanosensitive channel protein MscL [Bacteroidales bacterium]|nr:large-conductance mechanosensitive channel protein MscL [Bacteroidales bacterium]HNS47621.1 large-conductance mechanosensitive channel protein MscL [Bacteroidales bacterium]
MGMMKEFKEFAMKGNVMDMAIGIIIGAAFGKIVSSFVGDILMPPIGLLFGNMDFADIAVTLKQAVGDTPAVTMKIGQFINYLIDFLIVALAIFMVVKGLNSMKKKQEAAPAPPPEPTKEETLLKEIRDLLKK